MQYTTTITIDKPIAEVWSFFDDPANLFKWVKGFKDYKHLSGEPGAVGAKAKKVYEEGKRHVEMTEEIMERTPEEKLKLKITHPMVKTRVEYRFIEKGSSQTEIIATADVQFQSFLYSLLAPLMKGSFAKRQRKDFQRLKEVMERD